MKYFAVAVDSNYVAPVPVGWQGIIDKRTLHRKKAYEIQEHLLFHVESHMQMVYTDVITFPCFMVSETVKRVIGRFPKGKQCIHNICLERNSLYTAEGEGMEVMLYFPSGEERDGIALHTLRRNGENGACSNIKQRELYTQHGRKAGLYPDRMFMEGRKEP